MEAVYILNESDLKRWVREAIKDCLAEQLQSTNIVSDENAEKLLNRQEIAGFLRVSLVTLTDWIKRGLPSHKQRGRIYFDKREVLDYIKDKKIRQLKIGSKLHHLKQQVG